MWGAFGAGGVAADPGWLQNDLDGAAALTVVAIDNGLSKAGARQFGGT